MLPTASAFEHAEPRRRRARRRTSAASERACARCPVLHRTEADDAELARVAAVGALRLHRRRVAAAPAFGAQGVGPVRGAARGVPAWRGARGVGRGRDAPVRSDGRSTWRRVHRGPRGREEPRGVPVPRHRGRTPARTLDRAAPADRGARGHRRADRAGQGRRRMVGGGRGRGDALRRVRCATIYRAGETPRGLPA